MDSRICAIHFEEQYFYPSFGSRPKLALNAVPTLHLGSEVANSTQTDDKMSLNQNEEDVKVCFMLFYLFTYNNIILQFLMLGTSATAENSSDLITKIEYDSDKENVYTEDLF